MVALHRSGRQAEALRAFQRYRAQLATETGPGAGRGAAAARPAASWRRPPRPDAADACRGRPLRSYVLGAQLGEGAFAVVWRATQPSVGRDVAIKVIRAELANRPEFVRRFEAEAHLVARLEHPHIVPLYDYWREPDRAYLVMRWLRGGTLRGPHRPGRAAARSTMCAPLVTPRSAAALARRAPGRGRPPRRQAGQRVPRRRRQLLPRRLRHRPRRRRAVGARGRRCRPARRPTPRPSSCGGSRSARRRRPRPRHHPLRGAHRPPAVPRRARPRPPAAAPAPRSVPSVRAIRRRTSPPAVDEVIARATAKDPADRYADGRGLRRRASSPRSAPDRPAPPDAGPARVDASSTSTAPTPTRACGRSPRPTPATSSAATGSSTELVERLRPRRAGRARAQRWSGRRAPASRRVVRAGLSPRCAGARSPARSAGS